METRNLDHVVIGAGIAGLTCAWRLAKAGRRVLLIEARQEVGGVMQTKTVDGFLIEMGPNSLVSSPRVDAICAELGITGRVLANPIRENDRFVWHGGKLRKVPMGPVELIASDVLTMAEKLRALRGVFMKGALLEGDLPMGEFFRARLGSAVVEKLLKPFFSGIYAADVDRLSFESLLGKLFRAAQAEPSIWRAIKAMGAGKPKGPRYRKSLMSFPGGVVELPLALRRDFEAAGGEVRLGAGATIERGSGGGWRVTNGGDVSETNSLVIATPAESAAALVRPTAPELADALAEVRYTALNIVHAGLREEQLADARAGFGFLTAASQGVRALGVLWNDRVYPGRAPEGHRLVTMFYGGGRDPEAVALTDDELRTEAANDLTTTMGFQGGNFAMFHVRRWERAIPFFPVGHMRLVEKMDAATPEGLSLLGNYRGKVSVPDRVEVGWELAGELAGLKGDG